MAILPMIACLAIAGQITDTEIERIGERRRAMSKALFMHYEVEWRRTWEDWERFAFFPAGRGDKVYWLANSDPVIECYELVNGKAIRRWRMRCVRGKWDPRNKHGTLELVLIEWGLKPRGSVPRAARPDLDRREPMAYFKPPSLAVNAYNTRFVLSNGQHMEGSPEICDEYRVLGEEARYLRRKRTGPTQKASLSTPASYTRAWDSSPP